MIRTDTDKSRRAMVQKKLESTWNGELDQERRHSGIDIRMREGSARGQLGTEIDGISER